MASKRKIYICSISELQEHINNAVATSKLENVYQYVENNEKILKDLDKVSFNWENISCEESTLPGTENLIGYHTLNNGLSFLGFQAGGDWECPVFFIIYWDGVRLRGYIPTNGNTFNKVTGIAYGNAQTDEDEEDKDNAIVNEKEIIEDIKFRFRVENKNDVTFYCKLKLTKTFTFSSATQKDYEKLRDEKIIDLKNKGFKDIEIETEHINPIN